MESLKLYRIDDKYIRFLQSRDSRVQYNKNHSRPYVGIVLYVSEFKYFVPLESPKANHANIKRGKHIYRIGTDMGIMGFNNMVPVHPAALISFNIDDETDEQYANLLRRQISSCNRNKADILLRAASTYYDVVTKRNKFLIKISCDFKKLERAYKEYNPLR